MLQLLLSGIVLLQLSKIPFKYVVSDSDAVGAIMRPPQPLILPRLLQPQRWPWQSMASRLFLLPMLGVLALAIDIEVVMAISKAGPLPWCWGAAKHMSGPWLWSCQSWASAVAHGTATAQGMLMASVLFEAKSMVHC